MKSERFSKTLLAVFGSALALYVLAFGLMQNCRTSKGPWQVLFSTDNTGTPSLLITQSALKISKQIQFPDQKISQTNLSQEMVFNDPNQTNAPFGEIVFQDLTFLPGTVTFNFFGHGIELLPRVLSVDQQEHDWKNGELISITGKGNFKRHPRK